MRSIMLPAIGLALLAPAVPAQAQQAAEPLVVEAGVPTDCELHVWPAERFTAQTNGLMSSMGGGIGALIDAEENADDDNERRTQMASALDPDGQIAAIQSLDLNKLLGGKPATIYFHPAALERTSIGDIKTRRAASQSPCYSEVIVLDVIYRRTAIYGRSLRTLIWYRDFGASQTKARTYRGAGGNGLEIFPAEEGEDVQAANDELVSVFKDNFIEFAKNARRR